MWWWGVMDGVHVIAMVTWKLPGPNLFLWKQPPKMVVMESPKANTVTSRPILRRSKKGFIWDQGIGGQQPRNRPSFVRPLASPLITNMRIAMRLLIPPPPVLTWP